MTGEERAAGEIAVGEEGVWMFVFADLTVFSSFFLTFFYYRALDPEAFALAGAQLTHGLGLANTLVLLTSSWCAAVGVNQMRMNSLRSARYSFLQALCLGLLFVGIKSFEFYSKVAAGISLTSNDFFMFFFVFGGIHLVHVLVGVVVLLLIVRRLSAAERALSVAARQGIESGGIYWHLVDVLWVVLFTLFYLLV